jgi:hypothetical protein
MVKPASGPAAGSSCAAARGGEVIASMPLSLHIANVPTSTKVCRRHNDTNLQSFYIANMARSRPAIPVGWYLTEWMDTLHVRQSEMIRRTGWSKTTTSLLYNRQQDYNPELVRAAAIALNLAQWELLMPPAEAMALRRVRSNALAIAAEDRSSFTPAPPETDRLVPRRAG